MWYDNLENKRLWKIFSDISAIPRESGNEEGIRQYLLAWAKDHGIKAFSDSVGNVIMKVPATKGYEDYPSIALQGHMDMVAEKDVDSNHDFLTDPLEIYEEDGYLHATKTTLGADDGVAVAIMLALLSDNSFKHPRLECLFTVQEETTMDGITHVDKDWIHARKMISLDGDGVGETNVSSAGGVQLTIRKNATFVESHDQGYKFYVKGLLGGHSGDAIKEGRGNAIKIAGLVLKACLDNGFYIRFSSLNAGQKANVICRDGLFTFQSASNKEELKTFIHERMEEQKALYPLEPLDYTLEEEQSGHVILDSDALIHFLALCPYGVEKYSYYFNHFPVLSLNLGIMETTEKAVELILLLRSENEINLKLLVNEVETLASLFGLSVTPADEYYGWSYDPDSQLRKSYKEAYKKAYDKELKEVPTHGGLETGYMSRIFPDMDIVTMGPNCIDIHTPQERLEIKTLYEVHDFLKNWLGEL